MLVASRLEHVDGVCELGRLWAEYAVEAHPTCITDAVAGTRLRAQGPKASATAPKHRVGGGGGEALLPRPAATAARTRATAGSGAGRDQLAHLRRGGPAYAARIAVTDARRPPGGARGEC